MLGVCICSTKLVFFCCLFVCFFCKLVVACQVETGTHTVLLVGSTISQYKQLPWYFLVHCWCTPWVGNVMATVCAYIAMCMLHMQTTYTWVLYMHYIARIAVISNCAGWQLVYFRYNMYHEYFRTVDDKRPMRCMQPENQSVFSIATYTMYQLYFISISDLCWLSCMV